MARTETVTVLFTDLVGSTQLASRLGHDAFEVVRQQHFAACRTAAAGHSGTEVKSTGDGLMLSFISAADAVACAVALQQVTDRPARRAPNQAVVPVSIRVGVSSGEATREDADLYGPPVVEASRLCATAAPGQILASEVVRLLARGKGHTFISVGDLSLKGLPEPVPVCEVKWEPLAPAAGVPLPPRLATTQPLGLFGRSVEQEVLAEAWSGANEGQRRVVLLAGEPGIGKTRLAAETARAARADGATVLFGFCDEDIALPYHPFVEALRHYVAHAPEDVLAAHVHTHQGELSRLVPELRARVAGLPAPQVAEAETERYLLFDAAAGLLAAASEDAPIVLVLDDLHWAGAPELLLLKHIVRSAAPMRLLIVATYRDTDLTRHHPLTSMLADLRRESGVARLALRGLDEAAVVALVTASAGHELDAPGIALAQALHRETEGSPFFLTEILRNLTESAAVFREGERWTYQGDIAALGIPEGVKDVIGRRLGRLSEATNKVLSLAAVIGRQFDLPLLTRIADLSEDAILDALDEATAAALVVEVQGEPEHFGFSHALIRTTLYEELSSARRARLHRRAGEALEVLTASTPGARIDELAHHWLAAAQVVDAAKAIGYARQAGDHAFAGLAYEAAAAQYERALAVLDPTDREGELLRCDLLLALGAAQRSASDLRFPETAASAAAIARRYGDAHRLAVAALGSGLPGGRGSAGDTGAALYTEAIGALGPGGGILRARLLGRLAVDLVITERQRGHELSAEALEIARRTGDRLGLADVLLGRINTLNEPTMLAERLALTAEVEALADDLGSLELSSRAAYQRARTLLESGDPIGAESAMARSEQLRHQLRVPTMICVALVARAGWSIMRGAPDAEQQALAAYELGHSFGEPFAGAFLAAQLFEIRYRQGRCAEIAEAVRAHAESMPQVPAFRAGLALLYCESHRLTEAREQFERLVASGFDLPLDSTWAGAMFHLSEVCGALHDARAAEVLYAKLEPLAGQVAIVEGLVRCDGSLGHPAGVLAACMRHWQDAERHFEHAVAMNDRLGARPAAVRTRRAYAAMLLDRNAPGDQPRAADLITAALAESEPLDLPAEAAKLQRLRQRF